MVLLSPSSISKKYEYSALFVSYSKRLPMATSEPKDISRFFDLDMFITCGSPSCFPETAWINVISMYNLSGSHSALSSLAVEGV